MRWIAFTAELSSHMKKTGMERTNMGTGMERMNMGIISMPRKSMGM